MCQWVITNFSWKTHKAHGRKNFPRTRTLPKNANGFLAVNYGPKDPSTRKKKVPPQI